jgi:nucleoside-diphosphate-sugar epimerase
LDRLRQVEGIPDIDLLETDITATDAILRALEGIDTVYHLAAAHLGAAIPATEFTRVNVDGTRTLAEAARRAGVRRFVHCSSVGVYGRIDRPPADEDTPCRPDLPYERSKLAGEQVVRDALGRGLPAVILRPAWVYGPGCARTRKLFRAVEAGTFLVAGGGRTLRHCIYVADMVAALTLAAHSEDAVGATLVVADAEAVTVRELVDQIARLTHARRPRSVPLWMAGTAAGTLELVFRALGREPPVSRRSLRFFTGNTAFDIRRARQVLGFRPKYDVPAGLAETWEMLSAGASWDAIPSIRSAGEALGAG